MTSPSVVNDKQPEERGLIFEWPRKRDSSVLTVAVFLVTAASFAFMLHSLRIDFGSASPLKSDRTSLMLAGNDSIGMELKRRAREEGAFPLRFDLTGDAVVTKLEEAAMRALRWSPPPYVPALRPLPESPPIENPRLAATGELVFPRRAPVNIETPAAPESRPHPVLFPLSGINASEMPRQMPEFSGVIDAKTARDSWRFMIHTNASGRVLDSIALTSDDSPVAASLSDWLRQLEFQLAPGSTERWFVLDLGIINQAPHAPDPH